MDRHCRLSTRHWVQNPAPDEVQPGAPNPLCVSFTRGTAVTPITNVTLTTLMSERRTRELQTYEMKRRGFQSKQIRYASRRMPPTSGLDVDRPVPPNDNDYGCPIAANDVAAPIRRGNSTCKAPTETHHVWAQTTSCRDFRSRTLKQSEGAKG